MPSLSFVLPHWVYWSGLVIFPLVARYMVVRQLRNPPDRRPSLFIAYLFWFLSGFLGIHRFYVRSAWGLVFIPVFLGIIYCNAQIHAVRDDESRTFAAMEQAQTAVERARPRAGETPTPESTAALAHSEADLRTMTLDHDTAKGVSDHWKRMASMTGIVLLVMLLIDGVLLPRVVRTQRALEISEKKHESLAVDTSVVHEGGVGHDPTLGMHTRFTDAIERLNTIFGEFVAWWALIAVFAYYYEVLARFVFNSPTNWVHESTFLMFGMQYMLCGAYAYKEDQHVRVDVVYAQFSARGKAIADIITSVFFFIFIGTMVWTGIRFAADAIQVGEHSFTEWGIQYWPVKLAIPIGATLLLLQGICKLIKDIMLVTRKAT